MLRFVRTSSQGIRLPSGFRDREHYQSVSVDHATTIRFRTSHTANRGILYCAAQGTASSAAHLYLDFNATNAGELRFAVALASSTSFIIFSAPNVADGAWHTATLVRQGNVWRLFLDGAQVGADQTLAVPSSSTVFRYLGRLWSSATLFFDGDVEFVAYHQGLTLAEHTLLHNGSSPLGVGTFIALVPCGPSTAIDGAATTTFWNPALSDLPTLANHPQTKFAHLGGTAPSLVASSPDRIWGGIQLAGVTWGDVKVLAMRDRVLVPRGSSGQSDFFIREIGNVFPRGDGTYGLLYAGQLAAGFTAETVKMQCHLATSPDLADGGTWTKQGIVLPQATLGYYTEDPYVIAYGGYLWCFVEKRATTVQNDIALLRSSDGGATWTERVASILPHSTDASFDSQDTSSPALIQVGTRLFMFYEGRSSGDNGKIGLAWSDNGPEGPWTKFSNGVNQADPVVDRPAGGWYSGSVVPDDIFEYRGVFYLAAHGTDVPGNYRCGLFKTTDPTLTSGWTEIASISELEANTLMMLGVAPHPTPGFAMYGVVETAGAVNEQNIVRFASFGSAGSRRTRTKQASGFVEKPLLRLSGGVWSERPKAVV